MSLITGPCPRLFRVTRDVCSLYRHRSLLSSDVFEIPERFCPPEILRKDVNPRDILQGVLGGFVCK